MERIVDKKKNTRVILICVCVLTVLAAVGAIVFLSDRSGESDNLALRKGVIAVCDSVENETLSADKAIDGNDTDLSSRWSSENNWEDDSHYIELEFPEEISVSFVILKWERRNAVSYALESSLDGENWKVLQSFGY